MHNKNYIPLQDKNTDMKKKIVLFGLGIGIAVFINSVAAQKENKGSKDTSKAANAGAAAHNFLLTATSAGDSVILRWAPTDPVDWKIASQQGYILERTTLSADNKVEVRFEQLGGGPLVPWSKQTFVDRVSPTRKEDKYCAIAAQALYGASFKPAAQKNEEAVDEFNLIMKQHREDMMRHSFALFAADIDVKAATSLALRYVDKNVVKTKKYIYRVYAVPRPGLLEMDTAVYIISPKDAFPLNRVTFVEAASHNNAVFIQWPKNSAENNFTAFFIERSADDGKTFTQLNSEPFTNINGSPQQLQNTVVVFADTVPQLYKKYVYRVRGVNSFAQFSPYSLPVAVTAKDDKAPSPPSINKSVKLNARTYNISWRYDNKATDIKGYYVNRSKRIDSNFVRLNKTILPPTARTFTDSSATPGQSYYYTVTILDTAGNASASLPDYVFTYDSAAPEQPIGLTGVIDTNGVVTIKWKLGMEEDLRGYRIYKANAVDHEFTPVSKELLQDTMYHDTIPLKTLTKEIFYKIIAVDNNLNNSDYSAALRLVKPDIVPPVPAVFTNYNTSDTAIQLSWNTSSSSDLNKQYLYRQTGTGVWQQVAVLDRTQATYTDTAIQKQTLYAYRIVSEDSAGLKSQPSFPINAKTYFRAADNGGGSITAALQTDSAAIKVEWVLAKNTGAANIILYRSVNDGGMTMYETVPATETTYTDKRVSAGNTYKYSFKCIYTGNNESLLSKEAVVVVAK